MVLSTTHRFTSHSVVASNTSPLLGQMTSCKDRGLISYNEFLFLLAALSAPPRQFHLAFKMFDLDGNGVVDIEEFGLVQQAVQSQTSTGRRLHTMSSAAISEELLERSQMLQRVS